MIVRQQIVPAEADQYRVLLQWLTATLTAGARLLDVGAGDGDAEYHAGLRPLVGHCVGVDPDPRIAGNPWLDERHCTTLERWAAEPGAGEPPFDAAVAVYVVEHVDDPRGFLSSVHRVLAPGASLFVVTPNLWHYFGLLAFGLGAAGLDGRVLARLRGHDLVDEHHFPVRYRMNAVGSLRRRAAEAGFSALEVRHLDDPGVFQPYFPPALRSLPVAWSRAAYRLGQPALFGTIIARLVA